MEESRTNLIINYLPQKLTDKDFSNMFNSIGPLKNCRIMRDKNTNYSFGFGFADFMNPDDAERAILQLNNMQVQHKRIKVAYARPPGEDIKETNLYITNIPRHFTEEDLEELFASYGTIVQKNLLKDKITGLPRGVGFIRYDKKTEADLAVEQMDGHLPDGATEPLIVKIAEEHGKMKAAYQAGFKAAMSSGRGTGRGRGGMAYTQSGYGQGMGGYDDGFGGGYGQGMGGYNQGMAGGYGQMGYGGEEDAGYDDFGMGGGFGRPVGKMNMNSRGARFNPMARGGRGGRGNHWGGESW